MKTPLAKIESFDETIWDKKIPPNCHVIRDEVILELCKDKSVLHLGAADAPFHKEKGGKGKLLHQKLKPIVKNIVGVDVDKEAVEWLKANCNIDDIIVSDASSSENLKEMHFDIVLCCDIIEHVSDADGLLKTCIQNMNSDTRLLLTTINATAIKIGLRALAGREAVHQDHVAYYSYSTLCKLLVSHGLVPESVGFFSYGTVTYVAKIIFGILHKISSASDDGIMLLARLKSTSS